MHAHDAPSPSHFLPANRAIRARVLVRPCPVFFVRAPSGRALPPSAELEEYLQRWIMRELSGWAQLVVLELLSDGSLEWIADAVHGGLRGVGIGVSGQGPEQGAEQRLIAVRCVDRRGPRRPGLWAALSVASALAELLGGVVVDPRRSLEVGGGGKPLRPPADARVQTIDHLCVPSSRGLDGRRWLSTIGMSHFGLPDLGVERVPEEAAELGARLMLGVAQHLIDSSWSPPRPGDPRREVLLTVGELHWALGGEPGSIPPTRGRGSTPIALELDAGRAWLRDAAAGWLWLQARALLGMLAQHGDPRRPGPGVDAGQRPPKTPSMNKLQTFVALAALAPMLAACAPSNDDICQHILNVMKNEQSSAAVPREIDDEQAKQYLEKCAKDMEKWHEKFGPSSFKAQARCVMEAETMEELMKCRPDDYVE